MNATMIKGERSKLLAVAVVIAMVACALVAFMPSADATVSATGEGDGAVFSVQIGADEPVTYNGDEISTMLSSINTADDDVVISLLQNITLDISGATPNNAALWFTLTGHSITFNGGTNTITVADGTYADGVNVIGFNSGVTAIVSDLTVNGSKVAHHGFNIYNTGETETNVTLDNVEANNNHATGITVDGANVTATGITATGNGWGAVNVDHAGAFTLNEPAEGENDLGEGFQIYSEDAGEEGSTITAEGFESYGWGKNDATGSALFKDGTVGTLNLGADDVLVIPAGKTLEVTEDANIAGRLVLEPAEGQASAAGMTVGGDMNVAGQVNGIENIEVSGETTNTGVTISADGKIAYVDDVNGLKSAFEIDGVVTVKLNKDITTNENINSNGKKIDLNGNNLTVNHLNVYNAGSEALIVSAESTLSFTGDLKIADDGFVTCSGSTIIYASASAKTYNSAGSDYKSYEFTPSFETGTNVKPADSNVVYSIRHWIDETDNRDIQYGVAINDLTYTGDEFASGDITAYAKSFDDAYGISSSTRIFHGGIIDAGQYPNGFGFELNFRQVDSIAGTMTGEPVNVVTMMTVTVNPASSTATFDEYDGETVLGVDVDDFMNGVQLQLNGTTVTFTDGKLLYYDGNAWPDGTWPEDEQIGYYVDFKIVIPDGSFTTADGKVVNNSDDVLIFLGKDGSKTTWTVTVLNESQEIKTEFEGFIPNPTGNYEPTTYTVDFSGLMLTSEISIADTDLDTVYGADVDDLQSELTVDGMTISGDVYYFDGTWDDGVWGSDMDEGYYLLFHVDNITGSWEDATVTITGKKTNNYTDFDGDVLMFLGASAEDLLTTLTIKVDLGDRFTEETYPVTLDLDTAVNIDLEKLDSADAADMGGVSIDDLWDTSKLEADVDALDIQPTGAEHVYDVVLHGTVNWKDGYTWFNSADITEQRGYYIGFEVVLPGNMAWGDDDKIELYNADGTVSKTVSGDGLNDTRFLLHIDASMTYKVVVTVDGVAYTYNLDYSELDYVAESGFITDGKHGEERDIAGFKVKDVDDNTIYMAFNTKGQTDVKISITLGDEEVYNDTITGLTPGNRLVYLSFENQLRDTKQVGGVYTVTITGMDGTLLAKSDVTVSGAADYGFETDGTVAEEAMEKYGITITDMGDAKNVMWMVWYGQDYTNVTANVYYEDGTVPLFTETAGAGSSWLTEGVHPWYFSFGYQIEEEKLLPGKYTMRITTEIDGKTFVIAEEDYYIVDENRYTIFIDEDGEEYDREITRAAGEDFYLPTSGMNGKVIDYWYVMDGDEKTGYTVNAGAVIVAGGPYVYFNERNEYHFTPHYVTESGSGDDDTEYATVVINGSYYTATPGTVITLVAPVQPGYELVGWSVNGSDAQDIDTYIVTADDVGKTIVIQPVYEAEQGTPATGITQYEIGAIIIDNRNLNITATPVVGNTVIDAFYFYQISIYMPIYEDGMIVDTEIIYEGEIPAGLMSGGNGYDLQALSLEEAMADGATISITLMMNAANRDFVVGTLVTDYEAPVVPVDPVVEYYPTSGAAEGAIDKIYKENGRTDVPTDIGEQTMFIAFDVSEELVGEELVAVANYYSSAEAVGTEVPVQVHTQTFSFDTDGIHLWYFSFDPLNGSYIGTPLADGYYVLTITADGETVAEDSVTVTI